MIRSMLMRHLRHHARLLWVFAGGLVLFEFVIVWMSAQIDAGPGLRVLIELMPPSLREVLTAQISMLSFQGAVGFGFQHPIVLAISIAFTIVVGSIPAAERESGLLDLILAQPVPRQSYLIAVLLLLTIGAVALPSAALLGVAATMQLVEVNSELPWTRYIPCAAGLSMLMLAIAGYTLMLSAGARRRGRAAAQATGVTIVALTVDMLAQVWAPLRSISWLSPFHYFRPIPAAVTPHTPPENAIVLLGLFVVTTAVASVIFRRRDL